MNTHKTVRAALFSEPKKVELSAEKVELESIDILKRDASRMKKGISDLKSLRKQMRSEYLKAVDGVSTNAGKFSQKASDLGFKASTVKEYNEIFDLQKELDSAFYDSNKL